MRLSPRARRTTANVPRCGAFAKSKPFAVPSFNTPGRIIRPAGKAILSMNSNERLEGELRHALATLNAGA